jgi:sec-independent protein translocase protein TatA
MTTAAAETVNTRNLAQRIWRADGTHSDCTATFGSNTRYTCLVMIAVATLLLGGKKIPEVAKGLGEGIRNFKTALKGDTEKDVEKT